MSSTSSIRVEMQEGLAVVSLGQPARGNPFRWRFRTRLQAVVFRPLERKRPARRAAARRRRELQLRRRPEVISPGPTNLAPLVRQWTAELHMGLQRAWQLPVPIVAAVQGFAMGGGVAPSPDATSSWR
jgi:2-(1,2-epoxy-1,2-dihydrophenyl)acetyl-CoA isomerase